MRLMIGTLTFVLAGMVILAPTFRTNEQPIASLLATYRQHWPGQSSNLDECVHYIVYDRASRYECQLADGASYVSDGSTILALHLTPNHIRLGDGIQAFGKPDLHIHNHQFHFMRWALPPVTLVAHDVRGNWLMGVVDDVYLRG